MKCLAATCCPGNDIACVGQSKMQPKNVYQHGLLLYYRAQQVCSTKDLLNASNFMFNLKGYQPTFSFNSYNFFTQRVHPKLQLKLILFNLFRSKVYRYFLTFPWFDFRYLNIVDIQFGQTCEIQIETKRKTLLYLCLIQSNKFNSFQSQQQQWLNVIS